MAARPTQIADEKAKKMIDTRVVYLDPGKIRIETITLPELGPNQILVKTYQASVCGSERYFYQGVNVKAEDEARGGEGVVLGSHRNAQRLHGYPMGPLGHEGGGTVVAIGSAVDEYLGGGKVKVGDQVGSLIYPTYSDYWLCDPSTVQPIPEGVSFEVGCLYEPLGCAGWAALHMGVKLGDTVAINGAGFAGNILLQGAIKSGASRVFAIDVQKRKLAIARQLGADQVIDATEVDPITAINDLTHGEGVDVAVEAVGGTGAGITQALGMVRHNGIVSLYGDTYTPIREMAVHRIHEDALEIRSLAGVHVSKLRSIENMKEAYRAVQRGVFNLDIIFQNSVRYTLAEIAGVFAKENASPEAQDSLKTLILPAS
jgi:threonine dehydrogenase-like Zn-dependent dehydrogenase